jgi:hypothetical protein
MSDKGVPTSKECRFFDKALIQVCRLPTAACQAKHGCKCLKSELSGETDEIIRLKQISPVA